MKWLEKIIDDTLKKMAIEGYEMKRPDPNMHKEMIDSEIAVDNDWKGWKPISSKFNDSDLDSLEDMIGVKLPNSYRHFLKYKHFYSLSIPDHAVNIHSNLPSEDYLSEFKELFFKYYDSDLLIRKGYIYFADFQDYGLLCFDSNKTIENNEFPIVYIDHEELTEVHFYAENFQELLQNDPEKGNRFIMKLNEFHKK